MEVYIIFLLFVLANSYHMYKAGEKAGQQAGKFDGMISITQFYKQKRVLKDKNDINGFKNWPLAVQMLYADPNPNIFED